LTDVGRASSRLVTRVTLLSVLVAQGLRMLGLVLYRLSKFPSSVEARTTREVGASAAPAEEHAGEVCVV
jgi:microsomal dipeptidase-like Zn-dependent dipeptidase